MDIITMRAGALARRGWRATVLLALLAGLAAGTAMAAWALARRAETSFDRFLAVADPPDLEVVVCPPGIEDLSGENLLRCVTHDAESELPVVSGLPGVDGAGRDRFTGAQASPAGDPAAWLPSTVLLAVDGVLSEGEARVIEGRQVRPGPTPEVVVNERLRDRLGIDVGEQIDLRLWSPTELGRATPVAGSFGGPTVRVRVVGIGRLFQDLAAPTSAVALAKQANEARVYGGRQLAEAAATAGSFASIGVRTDDPAAVSAAVNEAFSDRVVNILPAVTPETTDPIEEAIRYEARGVLAFAALAAVAGALFAGQAVARQSRREWQDAPTLRALGMSDREAASAAALRGTITAAGAVIVAVASSIALSTLGPFGLARRAEVDTGPLVDPLVLTVGAASLATIVVIATWLPTLTIWRSPRPRGERRSMHPTLQRALPLTALAGVSAARSGGGRRRDLPTGTALLGAVLAVAGTVAAVGVIASLDVLREEPVRYGAAWDVTFAATDITEERPEEAIGFIAEHEDVAAAAGILGNDVRIGDEVAWVHALIPIDGVDDTVEPVITAGRLPIAEDEVALGAATMDEHDLRIGDEVEMVATDSSDVGATLTVVGTAVVNDSYEDHPGRGGVVSPAFAERYFRGLTPDPYVVRLTDDADVDAFRAALEPHAAGTVDGPIEQGAIRNVARVRSLPALLAILLTVLAMASLAHALVLAVRRQRLQIAVLKSLGFRRGQVAASVGWQAAVLVGAAIVVGVPLGVIVARRGWRIVAESLGVASGPAIPALAIVLTVGLAAVLGLAVAAYPAWRAARTPTAHALHVE